MLKFIWFIIIVLILIIGVFVADYLFVQQKVNILPITPTTIFIPSTIPTPTTRSVSPTTSNKINCNVGNIRNENCPPGCVNYGMPLGCVTQEYYDNCQKTHNCPICLSSSTSIGTVNGYVNVKNLKVGMLVWTLNKSEKKELQPIIKVSSTKVGASHKMIHLTLSDGRQILVSPKHPTITGKPIEDLIVGELYDGKTIISKDLIPYSNTRTYDLLPAGDTGFYFANGIPLGTTLK